MAAPFWRRPLGGAPKGVGNRFLVVARVEHEDVVAAQVAVSTRPTPWVRLSRPPGAPQHLWGQVLARLAPTLMVDPNRDVHVLLTQPLVHTVQIQLVEIPLRIPAW